MSSRMLDKRGKTFVMAGYVIAAGFVLIVFGILMSAHQPEIATAIEHLVSSFATIATVGIGALGLKGTVEGWQQGAQPSSEITSTVKTTGGAAPIIPPAEPS